MKCEWLLQGEDDVLECSWNEAASSMVTRLSDNKGKKNQLQTMVRNPAIAKRIRLRKFSIVLLFCVASD